MKSFRFILVLLVAAWVSGGTLAAQTDGADALRFPGIHGLSSRNLDEFFVQLERWSQDVKDKAEPNRYINKMLGVVKAQGEDWREKAKDAYSTMRIIRGEGIWLHGSLLSMTM